MNTRRVLQTAAAALAASMTAAQDVQLYGINYNTRQGPDWAPPAEKCKTKAQIEQELTTLAKIAEVVRIYSIGDCDQAAQVLPIAKQVGLKVELGLWVNNDTAVFKAEKEQFTKLVTGSGLVTSDLVVGIHVGSEAVYRKEITAAQNIDYMKEIKSIVKDKSLSIPVTIADIGDVYLAHPELIDAVDFVSANAFPFWERIEVSRAASYFLERMTPLFNLATEKNKPIVISETGWASHGQNPNASIASPDNAATYFHDISTLATALNWSLYYFEAFDESWKLAHDANNTVEAHFGLFHANGTLKAEYETYFPMGKETAVASSSTDASSVAMPALTSVAPSGPPSSMPPVICRAMRDPK
ncbi:hypothetical protein Poli38472_012192 [Pythium oligandrum]|uniref:glucan endo-1,3-beta-D-glucosidase n=1 Tax=Pythium oligandrum TaxID=41045 RepID=A0A8K1CQZ7_PYTOL|nr:hypothetical protein Poli38472_012192 [Pythium oligandrum]|eukprot:TMW67076.1 hypothetical protein Poli38472_012192 [Pythium oligandrum]